MANYLETGIGTAGQSLSERVSDSGHSYEVQSEFVISPTGTIYRNAAVGSAFVQVLGLTTGAEYDLTLVIDRKSESGNVGIWFGGTDLNNGYLFQCFVSAGSFRTRVIEYTGGSATFHMQVNLPAASTNTITLKVRSTTLELLEGATSLGSVTETTHVREADLHLRSSAAVTTTTGYHFDEASYVEVIPLPVITLLGPDPQYVLQNSPYIDPGATAEDGFSVDITGDIVVAGDVVDIAILGTYVVTYDVADVRGADAVQVTRDVIVDDGSNIQTPPYFNGIYPVSVLFTSADTSTDTATGVMSIGDIALNDGGGQASPSSGTGVITITLDSVPDQFTFLDVSEATTSTLYEDVQPITGVDEGETLNATNGLVSNDNAVTWLSSVTMIAGLTFVKASITSSGGDSTAVNITPTVNGVSDTFTVTTAAAILSFNITTIRTTAGATLTYTYPLGEIWSAVPEEGGTLLDSSASVAITNGTGVVQSNILQPSTEYLLILRDAGSMPEHYARQWGQFV